MSHACPRRQSGVSLVEAVVTLGIVASALQLAGPALGDYLDSVQLTAASQELYSDLQTARIEAIKRHRRVALCKSADGASCADDGGWEQGWILFHDENNNGRADAGEEVIRRHAALPQPLRMQGNLPVSSYISYTALGATRSRAGALQPGTVVVCRFSGTPTPSREIVINAMGRPRLQRATADTCV